ncbi:hydroxysteroid dehydrogenase [Dacryopinax primogenitus]|uniref:Hydroxysteroid dehydrogenase n=1 Tax=Dacryopinax primogenitus (strain DJM 731) TaxID=1858805 RepID=M5G420_DACPD|nr:hydroxysteroid dehydrogenase [Dacryopinax primogenitus]EJU03424.1 hydroxysteroid dehydrogenase [Dacryopinax primogenitus]
MPATYPELKGKVALITGSSRGIGKEYALALGAQGVNVVINYHSSAETAAAVVDAVKQAGGDAIAVQGNVSNVSDIAALFEQAKKHFGKIDIVISNAGVEHFSDLDKTTEDDFDRTFGTNIRAQFFVAQQAYRHVTHNGGRVILTSSISKEMSIPRHSVYASSKGAVEVMVRNMKADFGPLGVTINAVAPGGTMTDMAAQSARDYIPGGKDKTDAEILALIKRMSPLGRPGYAKDISNAVLFLVSDEAGWINGQTIQVSG